MIVKGKFKLVTQVEELLERIKSLLYFQFTLAQKLKLEEIIVGNKSTIMFLKYLIGLGFDLPLEENLLV